MDDTTRVDVGSKQVEIERSFARIDMDNLTKEVSEGNSDSTWWGILHARAEAEAARAKTRIDVVKAEVGKALRTSKTKRSEGFTVDVIKDEVTLDPRTQAAIEEHIQAEEKASILKSAKEGSAGKARTLEKLSVLIGQEVNAGRTPIVPPGYRNTPKKPVVRRPVP